MYLERSFLVGLFGNWISDLKFINKLHTEIEDDNVSENRVVTGDSVKKEFCSLLNLTFRASNSFSISFFCRR